MPSSELFTFLPKPALPSERVRQQAEARQARLTKPSGALGRLEQLACRLAAFTERLAAPTNALPPPPMKSIC